MAITWCCPAIARCMTIWRGSVRGTRCRGRRRAEFDFVDLRDGKRWRLRPGEGPTAALDGARCPARAGHHRQRVSALSAAVVGRAQGAHRRCREGAWCVVGTPDAALSAGGAEHRAGRILGGPGRCGAARNPGQGRTLLPAAHCPPHFGRGLCRAGVALSGKQESGCASGHPAARHDHDPSPCDGAGNGRGRPAASTGTMP